MARTKLPDPVPALRFHEPPVPPMGLIQGVTPASVWEWWFSIALDERGLGYEYQVDMNGGRTVRGGQVLDFLVWAPGGAVATFINGPYWHSLKAPGEDQIHEAEARAKWGKVLVMDQDWKSIREARNFVKDNIT